MKVILLAGGFGTRISEYTSSIPKPMIPIGGKPILWHIMNTYAKYDYKNFYIALGYKAEIVKKYFLNYKELNSDFLIDLNSGKIDFFSINSVDWKVSLIETGLKTMTGGRLKRISKYIDNEPFLLTYGDGLSNINIQELVKFHKSHGKMVTVTAVRPAARFGELKLDGDIVSNFSEKPQMGDGWINGGYFVIQPEFLNYIENDDTILEKSPLEQVAQLGELVAYRHDGFWQCMDTKRDHDMLEEIWENGDAPWM
jgi:glucose-1-phosphate cytidylyltransferase